MLIVANIFFFKIRIQIFNMSDCFHFVNFDYVAMQL